MSAKPVNPFEMSEQSLLTLHIIKPLHQTCRPHGFTDSKLGTTVFVEIDGPGHHTTMHSCNATNEIKFV